LIWQRCSQEGDEYGRTSEWKRRDESDILMGQVPAPGQGRGDLTLPQLVEVERVRREARGHLEIATSLHLQEVGEGILI
jgi:hypothetical protein